MNQSRSIRQKFFQRRFSSKTDCHKATATIEKTAITSFVLLICLIASSCSMSNPILGKWDPQNREVIIVPTPVEFTQDTMIYYSVNSPPERIPVEYKIKGKEVTVLPKDKRAHPLICTPTENDTLTCDTPFGKAVYMRRKQ